MFRSSRVPQRRSDVFHSNVSLWCYKAAARSAPIKLESNEALAEATIHPDWVAGISIGAINGALIAGNPPEGASTGCARSGRASPPSTAGAIGRTRRKEMRRGSG